MRMNKRSMTLLAVIALSGTATLVAAQGKLARAVPSHPVPAPMVAAQTGTKNIQIVDITPPDQIWPRVHVVYDFENYTVTKVSVGQDSIDVEEPVSLLKATP